MSASAWDYAAVEEALAHMYRIDTAHRKAFKARLQNFQRLGVPLDLKPGKGKKISYTEDEVFQWVVCLELSEYGINPATITNTIKAYWRSHLIDIFRRTASNHGKKENIVLSFSPRLLSAPGTVGLGPPEMLHDVDLQAGEWGPIRSALVINIGEIMHRLLHFALDDDPAFMAMTDTTTTTGEDA